MLTCTVKLLATQSSGFSATQAGPVVDSSLITCTVGQQTRKARSCGYEALHLWVLN